MVSLKAVATFLDGGGYRITRDIDATAEDYQGCIEIISEVIDILEDTEDLTLESLNIRRV